MLESSEASVAWLRARYIGLILITVSVLCLTQQTMPRHCVVAVQPIVGFAKSISKPKLEPKLSLAPIVCSESWPVHSNTKIDRSLRLQVGVPGCLRIIIGARDTLSGG